MGAMVRRRDGARAAVVFVCGLLISCGGDNMGQSNIKELLKQDGKVGTGAEAAPGRQVQAVTSTAASVGP